MGFLLEKVPLLAIQGVLRLSFAFLCAIHGKLRQLSIASPEMAPCDKAAAVIINFLGTIAKG